jgi:hypothetical protein
MKYRSYSVTKHGIFILVTIMFILLLSSCSSTDDQKAKGAENIGDGGFITGQPCGPPCFWGIYPGLTTEAQVLELLQSKGIESKCEQFDRTQEGGRRGITCLDSVLIVFNENIVEDIGFSSSEKITVEEVIKHFGEPSHILVAITSTPEYPETTMMLFFDEIRTSLVLPERRGTRYRVATTTEIVNIGYSDDTSYQATSSSLPGWDGYGEYGKTP